MCFRVSNFVESSNPWFNRGGNYNNGSNAGQFNFNRNTGNGNSNNSARLVLLGLNYIRFVFVTIKLVKNILYLAKLFDSRIVIVMVNLETLNLSCER